MTDEPKKHHAFKIDGYKWDQRVEIGRSPNGTTYKVQLKNKPNQFVAIRRFSFPTIDKVSDTFANELKTFINAKSPYIVKYIDSQIHKYDGYVVMELCDCDLETYLERYERKIPDDVAKTVIKSMIEAIAVLRENIIHSVYINPKNFLIKNNQIKFNPISSGKYYVNFKDLSISSAPLYMAPEVVLSGSMEKESDNYSAEIWSIGVMAYELAVGILPFGYRNWDVHKNKMIEENIALNQKSSIAADMRDFIKKCLVKEQKGRASWKAIETHPILENCENKIPFNLSPEIAIIWSRLKTQKQNQSHVLFQQKTEEGKFIYPICKYIHLPSLYQHEHLSEETREAVDRTIRMIEEDGLEKHELQKIFKRFKLEEENQYVFMWKLSRVLKKKNIDIYKISDKFDFNNNTVLDYTEMKALINSILPNTKQTTISKIYNFLKQIYNGEITTDNMLKELLGHLPSEEEEVRRRAEDGIKKLRMALAQNNNKKTFQYFDLNKDHKMSLKEFQSLFNTFVGFERQEEINIMFKLIDKNCMGLITQKQLSELSKGG